MAGTARLLASQSPREVSREHSLALGYLRAFLVLTVVAHHTMLAYHPYAPPPLPSLTLEPRSWLGFPIVDGRRSNAFLVLVSFNDIFLMALLFFLSGLFVWSSLRRKGPRTFLHDRLLRLGIPFVISAVLLTPLAYYPSYLAITPDPSPSGFLAEWFSMGIWPAGAGPAWFLWMLLAFDALAVILFRTFPDFPLLLERAAAAGPRILYGRLVALSALAYIPLAAVFGPGTWNAIGPFKLQSSRALLYLVYFLAGCAAGMHGIERGLLAADGALVRRWDRWAGAALVTFPLAVTFGFAAAAAGRLAPLLAMASPLAFVLSCATSSLAVLAVFLRFARTRVALLDQLRDNAYAIYVVHFVFVSWVQYALLPAPLPALTKGSLA